MDIYLIFVFCITNIAPENALSRKKFKIELQDIYSAKKVKGHLYVTCISLTWSLKKYDISIKSVGLSDE